MQTRSWRRTRVIWPCNDVSTVMLVAPKGTRLRRMALLYGGLVLGGVGLATFVVADLGLDPWDVLLRESSPVGYVLLRRAATPERVV